MDLYANFAYCTLTAGIAAADTVLTVDTTSRVPDPTLGEVWLSFDSSLKDGFFEIVRVVAKSPTTLTVARAQEGTTSPPSYANGTVLRGTLTAAMLERLRSAAGGNSVTFEKTVGVAEPCDSLANWSPDSGTWVANDGYFSQTAVSAGDVLYRLRSTPAASVTQASLRLLRAKIRIPSAGQAKSALYGGLVFGPNPGAAGGALLRLQRINGSWFIHWEIESQVAIPGDTPVSYVIDTWSTITVEKDGNAYSVYFDGQFVATRVINASVSIDNVLLYSNGTKVDFDDVYMAYAKPNLGALA